jgi:hypothetical protein
LTTASARVTDLLLELDRFRDSRTLSLRRQMPLKGRQALTHTLYLPAAS